MQQGQQEFQELSRALTDKKDDQRGRRRRKDLLLSQRPPVYPCRHEHMLFLIHTPPFLQGGLQTAGREKNINVNHI